jgi:hypothetical protein
MEMKLDIVTAPERVPHLALEARDEGILPMIAMPPYAAHVGKKRGPDAQRIAQVQEPVGRLE